MNDHEGELSSREEVLKVWYSQYYSTTSATANGSIFEKYMHRAMEAPFAATDSFDRVLEVGGNKGEHIPYVRHGFSEYVLTDLSTPQIDGGLESDARVTTGAADVQDLPYDDASFDRVVATCLLHHVPDPFAALQEMRRVVKPGGCITVLLPADPGWGYRTAQRVTSGRAAAKKGIGEFFKLVHAVDHLNHFDSISRQIDYVFKNDMIDTDWRPLRFPSWNINLFTVKQIRRHVS